MANNSRLIENINVAMVRRHMDVRKLADKLCLKPAALYMWFSEKEDCCLDRVTIRKLGRLCEVLNISVEELLDGVLK